MLILFLFSEKFVVQCNEGLLLIFTVDKDGDVIAALGNLPISMISYGASGNNISILIHSEDKEQALIALNNEFFAK